MVKRDDAGSALGKVPSKRSHLKSLVYPARTRRRRLWCGASGKRDGRGRWGRERECIVFASIQRAHDAVGGCWGALEGVSAGCRVGRCCRVKDVNARDTSRALGSAFAMHSMPSVKASVERRESVLFAYTCRQTLAKRRKFAAAITLIYSDRSLSIRVCQSDTFVARETTSRTWRCIFLHICIMSLTDDISLLIFLIFIRGYLT